MVGYHYTVDAALLLNDCRGKVQTILRHHYESNRRSSPMTMEDNISNGDTPISVALSRLEVTLKTTEVHLEQQLKQVLVSELAQLSAEEAQEVLGTSCGAGQDSSDPSVRPASPSLFEVYTIGSLMRHVKLVKDAMDMKKHHNNKRIPRTGSSSSIHMPHDADVSAGHCYYPKRNVTDTLLFRLIVALQLCSVRIDDVAKLKHVTLDSTSSTQDHDSAILEASQQQVHASSQDEESSSTSSSSYYSLLSSSFASAAGAAALAGLAVVVGTLGGAGGRGMSRSSTGGGDANGGGLATSLGQLGFTALSLYWMKSKWNQVAGTRGLGKSSMAIAEWNRQWMSVVRQQQHDEDDSEATRRARELINNANQPDPGRQHAASFVPQGRNARGVEFQNPAPNRIAPTEEPNQVLASGSEYNRNRLLHQSILRKPTPSISGSIWDSQGGLRFFMLKRAMDVFYASVGTAMQVTAGSSSSTSPPSVNEAPLPLDWQLTLATAAAASYYSLTGAEQRALQVTASSPSNRASASSSASTQELLHKAWGMVSLPAIKNLSLQASRMLKGAAVADRIELAGVPCFVLSADPAPELATAIEQYKRRNSRRLARRRSGNHGQAIPAIPSLSTIDEKSEHAPDATSCGLSRPFARRPSDDDVKSSEQLHQNHPQRQRDVILHLTGGGFFAHIIASDLPWLLDWSRSTGAVIICPEYALLPEHAFPTALVEVTKVYQALVNASKPPSVQHFQNSGSCYGVPPLGFEVDRIVVTGESTGGNLAAALCVNLMLCSETPGEQSRSTTGTCTGKGLPCTSEGAQASERPKTPLPQADPNDLLTKGDASCSEGGPPPVRLPDALMLSCPVLNLSFDVLGNSDQFDFHQRQDPVLPTGLVSAISDAYLPQRTGVSKRNPLASPFYAGDTILCRFPPTLMFASSTDVALLDDVVVFNQRLKSLGVNAELRAAENLPHAYLGLGTAGFPEAQQVQLECQQWLLYQLTNRAGGSDDCK